MKGFTIAAAHHPVSADVRTNGRWAQDLLRQASDIGVGMVHFLEGALSGFAKSEIKDWSRVDWRVVEQELEAVARLAGDLGLWVVLGCNHRLTAPHRPHNSLYVISNRGCLLSRYDKRYCSHSEITDWYSPGFDPLVFEAGGLRFGCALCVEIQFPEIFDEYRRLGVDVVLLSINAEWHPMFPVTARAHAGLYGFWISFAVPSHFQNPMASLVIGPDGEVVAETVAGRPGLAAAVLDPQDPRWEVPLRLARPWRAAARRGDIYREKRVIDPRSAQKTRF